MNNLSKICALTFSGLCVLVVAQSAAAESCRFTFKNCVRAEKGTVEISVYNEDDSIHLVPTQEVRGIGHGESVELSCRTERCDHLVRVTNRPDGQQDAGWNVADQCLDGTLQGKLGTYTQGIQGCID